MNEKKNFFLSTQLPLAVLLVLCLITCVQNARMTEKIENMQMRLNSVGSKTDELGRTLQSFEQSVDEAIAKQSSMLTSLSCSFGEFSNENGTVAVTLTAVPKSVTSDLKLSVSLNGQTAYFEQNGSEYTATLQAGLFEQYDPFPVLTATGDGVTKTESLTSVDLSLLYERYLPGVYCNLNGNETATDGSSAVVFGFSLRDAQDERSEVTFERFYTTQERNGVMGEKQDITQTVRDMQKQADREFPECDFTLRVPVAENESVNLHLSATDSLGYVHTVTVTYENTDSEDTPAAVSFGNEKIYDADGRLMFGFDKE